MSLSKTIARERETQEKSLRDVAKATGLSRMAVFNVERDRSTLATALRVAKSLGIKGQRLLNLAKAEVTKMVRAA